MGNFKPEQQYTFLLAKVSKLLRSRFSILPNANYPLSCMQVMVELFKKDNQIQQDLADRLGLNKSSITKAVKYLYNDKMVVKTTDPEDRRSKRISLSKKGRKIMTHIQKNSFSIEEQAINQIPESDLKTFKEVLNKMYNNLYQED